MSESATETEPPLSKVRTFIRRIPDGTRITDASFQTRHRVILAVIALHIPFLFLLSRLVGVEPVTGAEFPVIPLVNAIVGIGIIAGFVVVAAIPQLPRRIRSSFASLGFMTCAAVLAYFSGGFIEAHFVYFVGVGVVALYEDWVPFAVSIGYVAAQHSIFGLFGHIAVFNHPAAIENPAIWGLIHAVFVSGLAIAILFNWQSLEATHSDLDDRVADIEALEAKQREVAAAREEAEAQREQMGALNETLRAEAAIMADALSAVANRDLTQRPPRDSDIDAMQQVSSAYTDMTHDLSTVITELRRFADSVESTTESARNRAERLERTQREQAEDVRELSDRLREQVEGLESASDEMSDLSAAIEEIASSAEEVSAESSRTAEITDDGTEQIQAAIDVMDDVDTHVSALVELIEAVDTRMDSVSDATALIDDIAEQTNILALNANIEAARASGSTEGGAGDGFAVVADEVKKLADQTQDHSATIRGDVEGTLEEVTGVRNDIDDLRSLIDDGRRSVDDAGEVFESVADSMSGLEVSMEEVARATDDGAATAEEVTHAIVSVADQARAIADESDTAAASSEQTAQAIADMREELTALGDQTGTLQAELDRFDTVDVETPTARAVDAPSAPARPDGGSTH
ncbi:methyl-accepting chemotaxis protein [Halalkalirubrum salinum]|uniref:methyl-accepting chemotaxis protein n=1 Tax=Halalkalirubrum salinum TaxID=2563889 RepID=UPI001484F5A8|nr:methyl-accepting chemotaxis protein [Halalkalirubrum salinum]